MAFNWGAAAPPDTTPLFPTPMREAHHGQASTGYLKGSGEWTYWSSSVLKAYISCPIMSWILVGIFWPCRPSSFYGCVMLELHAWKSFDWVGLST